METPSPSRHRLGAGLLVAALLLAGCRDDATTSAFQVDGMYCDGCAETVEEIVGKLPGVKTVEVSYEQRRMVVVYDPARVRPEAIRAAVEERGYQAEPRRE